MCFAWRLNNGGSGIFAQKREFYLSAQPNIFVILAECVRNAILDDSFGRKLVYCIMDNSPTFSPHTLYIAIWKFYYIFVIIDD